METLDPDPILLEPGLRVPAHEIPPERRWIEIPDGKVAMYGVCPPVQSQLCRVEHALVCPNQPLPPDPWPRISKLREANAARVEQPVLPLGDEQLPDVG
ncbi:DUF6083 domain-containing protein [Streptomyces durmitorensis]